MARHHQPFLGQLLISRPVLSVIWHQSRSAWSFSRAIASSKAWLPPARRILQAALNAQDGDVELLRQALARLEQTAAELERGGGLSRPRSP